MSLAENVNAYVNLTRLCSDIRQTNVLFGGNTDELDKFHAKVLSALEKAILEDIDEPIQQKREQTFAMNVIAFALLGKWETQFAQEAGSLLHKRIIEEIKKHEPIQQETGRPG